MPNPVQNRDSALSDVYGLECVPLSEGCIVSPSRMTPAELADAFALVEKYNRTVTSVVMRPEQLQELLGLYRDGLSFENLSEGADAVLWGVPVYVSLDMKPGHTYVLSREVGHLLYSRIVGPCKIYAFTMEEGAVPSFSFPEEGVTHCPTVQEVSHSVKGEKGRYLLMGISEQEEWLSRCHLQAMEMAIGSVQALVLRELEDHYHRTGRVPQSISIVWVKPPMEFKEEVTDRSLFPLLPDTIGWVCSTDVAVSAYDTIPVECEGKSIVNDGPYALPDWKNEDGDYVLRTTLHLSGTLGVATQGE